MHHPRFLLGVGAQKAGTSWLHRALLRNAAFAPGVMKEYHVWDALSGIDADGPPRQEGQGADRKEACRAGLLVRPEAYHDHFAGLLTQSGKTLTADLTPAYAALPGEILATIAQGFAVRGIAAKAVFIMRDPVERLWSAVRMYRRKGLAIAGLDPLMPEADYVAAYARLPHAHARGRYEQTIAALQAAFGPEDRLVLCFEHLFLPETLASLSAFLGLEIDPVLTQLSVNTSPKQAALPSAVRDIVISEFAETLAFCREVYPETVDLWESQRG